MISPAAPLKAFTALLLLALCGSASAAATVNVNTADAATLDRALVGVDRGAAKAIVEYRRRHGPFRSAEQLAMVRGIGMRTVERNANRIVLEDLRPEPGSPGVTHQEIAPVR